MAVPNAGTARLLTRANNAKKVEREYQNFLWHLECAIADSVECEFISLLNNYPDELITYLEEKGYEIDCCENESNLFRMLVSWS